MAAAAEHATLYRARYLLPVSAPPLEDGALLVRAGQIAAVGPAGKLIGEHPDASRVDFGEAVLLPPLVNAHTHLELSDFPDWAASADAAEAPADFVSWILQLVRVRRQISSEQLCDSLANGLKAALACGTGAVGDILTTLEALPAYRSAPLYGRVYAEVLGHDLDSVAGRLDAIAALLAAPPSDRLTWGLAPHAPYTLSVLAARRVFDFAGQHTLQCAMHLAESPEESRFLANGSGAIADSLFAAARWDPAIDPPPRCSPVQALCRQGKLGRGDLAVHGVQVDGADIALLKSSGCSVVLCPRSNASLAVGLPPVATYLAAGVPLALGTDSLASAPSLSIWDEIAFARNMFQGQVSPRDWLTMATAGGAKALSLQDRLGRLDPGRPASFQVVALPQLPAPAELEEALCSGGPDLRVCHLYLDARNVLPEC